jgi:putative AbiEi antitoxin of type IV toxin-antitoxin system
VRWREAFDRLADHTRGQHGLVTRAQARLAGVDDRTLHRLVRGGDLERVARGVYRFRRDRAAEHQDVWAAWLRLDPASEPYERKRRPGGPDAIVSHESAAKLYRLGGLRPTTYTFTVPQPRRSGHRDIRLVVAPVRRDEWELEAGLPTTRPGRIVADLLAGGHDEEQVLAVALDAVRLWRGGWAELVVALAPFAERYGGPSGDGEWLLQRLLADRPG